MYRTVFFGDRKTIVGDVDRVLDFSATGRPGVRIRPRPFEKKAETTFFNHMYRTVFLGGWKTIVGDVDRVLDFSATGRTGVRIRPRLAWGSNPVKAFREKKLKQLFFTIYSALIRVYEHSPSMPSIHRHSLDRPRENAAIFTLEDRWDCQNVAYFVRTVYFCNYWI